MSSRRESTRGAPIVLSLMVQAEMPVSPPTRGPFSVLVRHLFDRLIHSDSLELGEESASRVMALAYAVALPGMLYALYLFPAYHSPLGKPPFWSQARDHLFYTSYGFAVMGLATVLQWDLLFPDLIDTLVLGSLPVPHHKLLLAPVAALSIFFGAILLGTSVLGIIFLPLVSELPGMALRQLLAHAVAVLMAGLCAASSLVALQGTIICVLGQSAARRLSPLLQTGCVLILLTSLFSFPLLAHSLEPMLQAHSKATLWFTPFWFLGLYEILLHGSSAPALFFPLARAGVLATALAVCIALLTYPLAYVRRVRQTVEGVEIEGRSSRAGLFARLAHRSLRDPRAIAIAHWISQSIWRTQPTRLVLAVFGGLGFATTAAAVLTIHPTETPAFSPAAILKAIPMVAFWIVAGLRTAMRIPVAPAAAWVFRAIHGRPKRPHLLGAEAWVAACSTVVTCIAVATLHSLCPKQASEGALAWGATLLSAIAIPVLLTEIFLLVEWTIPFTEALLHSVNELSYVVLTYFACFPLFVFSLAIWESWMAISYSHLLFALAALVGAHAALRVLKQRLVRQGGKGVDMEGDGSLLPGEMGLRN